MADTEPRLPSADAERFPALEKLTWRKARRRVPFVQQLQAADCGAASLAMVLGYHGRHARLDDVRDAVGDGGAGADALSILRAGESFGMRGRGLKLEVEDLDYLPPASVLHWEFNHFVVYEKRTRGGVSIVDPARGRRTVPMDRFRKAFTGVALVLEPTDEFEKEDKDRTRIWSYLRQLLGQSRVLSRVVVISIVLRLFALALPILTGLIVDRVVPRGDERLLYVVGAGLGAVVVFHWISSLIRGHLLLQLRTNLDTRMTLGFMDYLVSLPYAFFQRRSAGDLMMRVNSNRQIREILTANTISALLDGSLVIFYLIVLFLYSPPIGFLVLGLGLLQVSIFWVTRKRYRELMAQELETEARAQSYLVQILAGVETLKCAGSEGRAVEHWSNLFVDELNTALRRGRVAVMVESLIDAVKLGSPLLILSYGASLVMDGDMTLGTMLALNALAVGFLTPLATLVNSGLQLQLLGGYIERIDDVLSSEPEQDRAAVVASPRLSGAIEVDDVSFRYSDTTPMVLRDVSVRIDAGANVAIVGKSGSGKSTLAYLLLGLFKPGQGNIRYDGRDLAELDFRTMRRQLGIVPQHPYLFGESIRTNIALSNPDSTIDRVVNAAKLAGIHEEIMAMPMGYETILADGGATLSGGQRQRIALARAIANRPSILLLDEATSALDTETELRVMRNLEEMRCTRVVIAHRLSTIVKADRILVMDEGRIVETGTHDELLAAGGVYAGLVSAQTATLKEAS